MRLRRGDWSARPLLIALLAATAVAALPGSAPAAAAATLGVQPGADAWVNKAKAGTNYGSATTLRARKGAAESYIRFNLSAWQGLRVSALDLVLRGVEGTATSLRVSSTGTAWSEGSITWKTRPAVVQSLSGAPSASGGQARFDLRPLFPTAVVDRTLLSVRITNNQDTLVTFGSRESTPSPRLELTAGPRLDTVGLAVIQDTWANSAKPSLNYKSAANLKVRGQPRQEAFLKFDLSAWQGHSYDSLRLDIRLSDGGGGVSVYRVGTGWKEGGLTWNNRPSGGTLLVGPTGSLATGAVSINVTSAYSGRKIDTAQLGLRIVSGSSNGIAFSSREGASVAILRLKPASTTASPSPSPSASPSPSPSASPSPSPSPSPSQSPSPSPSSSPSASSSPSPSPSPTPEPLFYLRGNGSDHGVGLSQYGARYRANAGQTYQEILAHYYDGTALGTIQPGRSVRVLLASSYKPTETLPARVSGLFGAWQSAAFPGSIFPAGSYLQMSAAGDGTWVASVVAADGTPLAEPLAATDIVMEPAEATTIFEMKFRDSLKKYDRYRGQMRLRVNADGIMAVNIVSMSDYLRGVVPAEMPASWHMNAVRSQAIASRGYAHAKLRTTGFHDVVPTSADQVYGGVNIEQSRSNTAVLETNDIVVTYDGKPVQTFFFALAGGHTEHNEFVFGVNSTGTATGTPLPYLRGKPDLDPEGLAWDRSAPNYAWQSASFRLSELSAIMGKSASTNVGELISVTFERGVSSRVYRATLVGTDGTKTVSGNVFKNVYNTNKLSGGDLRSNMYFLEPAP